jgi:hypothetical protein
MKRIMSLVMGVSIVGGAAAIAAAQEPAQDAQKGKTVMITGCLAAGADAKSFTLNDAMPAAAADKEQSKEASKSSEMRSYRVTAAESLKLEGHVGHKVTLTGTVDEKPAGAGTPGAAGTTGGAKPTPSLSATALKMVSPSCSQ